ncbi:SWI/SNF-related matrix-associated actin-dependent regulator of chromatin subfamily D [Nematocida displodere]|uniref:SWI/SNF-related matrix-associated actin-dependent regulator of chromatin subfamily D n=1 Tax=Nematocida displodere TaxID=1805483 RepID=A0A177ED90_9MICR|nr:SWI/SNF-related matrix-associated actin-dependent regulator of chromatin subfamily D [Nematocida displodere]
MERSERLMSLFQSLLVTEKRLDQAITKKKMSVEEAHFKKIKKLSTVRINLAIERNSEGGLFLLVGGKIKTEAEDGGSIFEARPLGSAISKLLVHMSPIVGSGRGGGSCLGVSKAEEGFSRGLAGERCTLSEKGNNFFEWHNSDTATKTTEWEIKTKCLSERGTVFLSFISQAGSFSVCKDLAEAIGVSAGSKPVILLGIWKYITAQKMRDTKHLKNIICNDVFQSVFKVQEISFREIIERLDEFISPLDMITIDFDIPVTPGTKTHAAYDITVELEQANKEYAYSDAPKIAILDKKISDIQIRIAKQSESIAALESFIADPKRFITSWILESSKALHLISDDLYEVDDGFYVQKEIQESVYQLLQNYK